MAMFGKSKRGTWYGTLLGIAVGLGLGMGSGGRALATESENGEAEAAPAAAISERAAGRLETPEPERDPVNPARIVAHTAQLPKSRSKPLFPVELPGAKSGPQVQAPSASPGSGVIGGVLPGGLDAPSVLADEGALNIASAKGSVSCGVPNSDPALCAVGQLDYVVILHTYQQFIG